MKLCISQLFLLQGLRGDTSEVWASGTGGRAQPPLLSFAAVAAGCPGPSGVRRRCWEQIEFYTSSCRCEGRRGAGHQPAPEPTEWRRPWLMGGMLRSLGWGLGPSSGEETEPRNTGLACREVGSELCGWGGGWLGLLSGCLTLEQGMGSTGPQAPPAAPSALAGPGRAGVLG